MTETISAEPEKLYQYADRAMQLDAELTGESNRLVGMLGAFAATCFEPESVATGGIGEYLCSHAENLQSMEQWVRAIGRQFELADQLIFIIDDGGIDYWIGGGWFGGEIGSILVGILVPPDWLIRKLRLPRNEDVFDLEPPITELPVRRPNISLRTKGEDVPGDDGRRTLKEVPNPKEKKDVALYYRGGKGRSNCTWYAAAAIKQASNGKIDLNSGKYGDQGSFTRSLGNAGEWATNARAAIDPNDPNHEKFKQYQDSITAVDNKPTVGSVYCLPVGDELPSGHVMFVEDVKEVEVGGKKQWQVVVSEENWGGGHFKGAEPVTVPGSPDVGRWRRTITLDADPNDPAAASTNGSFIHFNY